ncbi:unnamed protein product [Albugo candida]|uniref:Shugoshin C-terminal domain-containing protein n=1 Tax=Albugo candida TaxID=65357 RepID=A0A024G6G4_9STRA|nr:unnamed protein product [Albugo candida]|eukprot:CCI42268.1 unnamed protein product [Albugo candida]
MAPRRGNIGYMYTVMEEMQHLRQQVSTLTDKNRHLARHLNTTKEELCKVRKTANSSFTAMLSSIMSGKETETKGIQCEEILPSEVRSVPSEAIGSSPIRMAKETLQNLSPKEQKTLSSVKCSSLDVKERENRFLKSEDPTQAKKRTLRQRKPIRYIEPSLKTKLRQGRYYGLLRQSPPSVYRHRASKKRKYASVQRQTFRLIRQSRARAISYVEPKLNTKLRQVCNKWPL